MLLSLLLRAPIPVLSLHWERGVGGGGERREEREEGRREGRRERGVGMGCSFLFLLGHQSQSCLYLGTEGRGEKGEGVERGEGMALIPVLSLHGERGREGGGGREMGGEREEGRGEGREKREVGCSPPLPLLSGH